VGQHPPRRPPRQDGLGRAGRAHRAIRRCRQVGRPDSLDRRSRRLRLGGLRRRRAGRRHQASHGGSIWEAQYYLQQLALYQKQHGTRLLDYFDEHYYPTTPSGLPSPSDCIALCEEGDAATQAARLQATRSLWDPSFVENDWIGQYYGDIDLIPRMKSWVNQYYPGTKTAITEYNFGALDSMNGALAQADALGIFGAQGLDLATLWGPPTTSQPGAYAFRMYRDYDGQGSTFGDTSVQATSTDQGQLSVYAATRSSDGALTVMVVNKTAGALDAPVSLGGFASGPSAQLYTYDGSNLSAIVRQPDQAITAGSLTTSFPANSISLLVIPPAGTHPVPAPGAQGYWEVAADGGVFTFGDAAFYGSMGGRPLDAPIVGLVATPDGKGYWEVASDGASSASATPPSTARWVAAISTRPSSGWRPRPAARATGRWPPTVASSPSATPPSGLDGRQAARCTDRGDGAHGRWRGLLGGGLRRRGVLLRQRRVPRLDGGKPLNAPIVSMAPTSDGAGYWEVASDGGIFNFGDATFHGSMAERRSTGRSWP